MDDDNFVAKTAVILVLTCTLFGGLAWGFHACSTAEKATLGAVDAEVDRRNFEHSQAYREGLRRDCDQLMLAYAQSKDPAEKEALISTLRHRLSAAPPEAVPADAKAFLGSHTN